MRLLLAVRYGALGVFVTGVLSVVQGCNAREGGLLAFLLFALNFCTGPRADQGDMGLPPPLTTLYVTSFTNDKVFRANLDGTGGQDLGNLNGINGPRGIALDLAHGKMYVTSANNDKVFRANLDGTGGQDLGSPGGIAVPNGIALDLTHGKMYLTSFFSSTIFRANLDGTGGQDLGSLAGSLLTPEGIALDLANGKMYVVALGSDKVFRANLDGTGAQDLGNLNGINDPFGIALSAQ